MNPLTIENFTRYYIFHPLSDTLSPQDSVIAVIASAALAILSLGISHLMCALFFYDRNFLVLPPPPPPPPQRCFWDSDILRGDLLGLNVGEFHREYRQPAESRKYQVRDLTKGAVARILGVLPGQNARMPEFTSMVLKLQQEFVADNGRRFALYSDDQSTFTNVDYLLGSFDVLATPCCMDYDWRWNGCSSRNLFMVHHAAAINIGETGHAEDFAEYATREGRLDVDKYVEGMGHIFHNILEAQMQAETEHNVWFPFGMGAFLRRLGENDPTYNDPVENFNLRKRIAAEFVAHIGNYPRLLIYLCLPTDDEQGSATNQNHNAFVNALADAPADLRSRVRLYINVDATQLAQNLADQNGDYRVSMVNGANRKLLGNRWFADRALTAIDENLHRRSSMMAASSAILNGGFSYATRTPDELAERVRDLQAAMQPMDHHGGYSQVS